MAQAGAGRLRFDAVAHGPALAAARESNRSARLLRHVRIPLDRATAASALGIRPSNLFRDLDNLAAAPREFKHRTGWARRNLEAERRPVNFTLAYVGDEVLERHLETAEGCLSWIDDYATATAMVFRNTRPAPVYPDGSLVKGPKALCELQGYVYDAWIRMADVFDALGKPERAKGLRAKSSAVRPLQPGLLGRRIRLLCF
jgi:hypothetical protein